MMNKCNLTRSILNLITGNYIVLSLHIIIAVEVVVLYGSN